MEKSCIFCSNVFISNDKRKKFCNNSCSAKYNNPKKKKIKHCIYCNNVLKTGNKYCSNACQGLHIIDTSIKSGNFSSKTAKKYLILKNNCCSICKILPIWNNKNLIFILDHINGNPYDNSLSNLRLVCPNCDSQLDTYKNKNKGNGRHNRKIRYKNKVSY